MNTSLSVMLSQGSQTHNHTCCVGPFIYFQDEASLVSGVRGQRLAGGGGPLRVMEMSPVLLRTVIPLVHTADSTLS